jgi:hypothetical protein
MNFSMNTRSSPKLDLASERAEVKPSLDLLGRIGDAHALAAAAGRGLDHHRIADLVGDLDGLLGVGDLAEVAGHGRHLGLGGRLLALDLVAHGGDRLGVGTDEDDAGLRQRDGEGLALGQEAVARMHGLGAGLLAGLHDLVDHQVGLGGGGGPISTASSAISTCRPSRSASE